MAPPEQGDCQLMGQVVRLADRARNRPGHRPAPGPLGARAYYCTHCDGDRFMLYPGGAVQCAACGAQMENLAVAEPGKSGTDPDFA
jgi:hypothetical protein